MRGLTLWRTAGHDGAARPGFASALAFSILLGSATGLSAQARPTVKKLTASCTPQGCRIPIYTAPSAITFPYTITVRNNDTVPRTFRVVDDVPPKALAFRVTDRGDGQPCGAPGGPTCSNVPAPGGANGTGRVVIDGLSTTATGSPLAQRSVTFEVDYSCPPMTSWEIIGNQALVYTPSDPTICNPCVSDDPNTPRIPDDPSQFMGMCLPPPELSIVKTGVPSAWSPGQDRTVRYTIDLVNQSATETLVGGELKLFEYLPTLRDGFTPAFDPATCPLQVTATPPVALDVDNTYCAASFPFPYSEILVLDSIAPGQALRLGLSAILLDGLKDDFEFCNEVVAYYFPTGATANSKTCTIVRIPQVVDFRDSVKSVTPDVAAPGTALLFRVQVVNTGTGSATLVRLSDSLAACLDDTGFDPALHVLVDGNPPASPATYVGRTLTLELGAMGPGARHEVTIDGLKAGAESCCNQGVITAWELPAPGQVTGGSGGRGEQACYAPRGVAFSGSLKSVSPDPVTAGDPLAYTVTVNNTGAKTAHDVVVTDVLPDCIDDGAFDPLADVTVTPGPAAAIRYQPAGRLLNVELDSMGPLSTQVIVISGLRAGAATAACCNQAFIASQEVPPLGDPTSQTPGSGDPTCGSIVPAIVACDLHRDLANAGTDLATLYNASCSPGDPRLGGAGGIVQDVQPGQQVDTVASVPGFELVLYQLGCACAHTIRLARDPGPPASVRLEY